jgi:predicted negative regulator of RcsB-dependent stress response
MTDVTTTDSQTLEQTLNKTDFGHVLFENRKSFFALLIAILVGAMGFVLWKQTQSSSALKNAEEVFKFQHETWTNAKAGKIPTAELVTKFKSLNKDIQSSPIMVPVALDMGKFLFEKGSLNEAEEILSAVDTKNDTLNFFVGLQRAVILEKLGNIDGAIGVLEKLNSVKEGLMPQKVSLDLGRLYLAKGEKAKAQSQFETVINTYPNDEQAKVAKLYLSQIAK